MCHPASSHVKQRRPFAAAFSLVELLVVIGIIGLLIAILLPTLSGARERARQLKCLAVLRGISQAAELHVLNHNGYLPAAGHHWNLVGDQLDPNELGDLLSQHTTHDVTRRTRRKRQAMRIGLVG